MLTPMWEYILIEPTTKENAFGIIITEEEWMLSSGVVKAIWSGIISNGIKLPIDDIEIGDIVHFPSYVAEKIESHKLLLVKYQNIIAKI